MKKLKPIRITNIIIKLFFFLVFPSAWATGFAGVKYLCEQIHSGKPIEMKAFLITFIALAGFTIVFGRFFCGRACAFGTYGDVLYGFGDLIRRKTRGKSGQKPGGKSGTVKENAAAGALRYVKYIVLVAVCLLCITGYSGVVSGASPWTAFSHIRAGKFGMADTLSIVGMVLFVLLSIGMMVTERFFCRFLCPFGAVFSLLPMMPWSIVSRDRTACIRGCKACANACPARLQLPYRKAGEPDDLPEEAKDYAMQMGECFQCGRCAHVCPKANAGSFMLRSGTKGIVIDVCKAALLAAVLYLAA